MQVARSPRRWWRSGGLRPRRGRCRSAAPSRRRGRGRSSRRRRRGGGPAGRSWHARASGHHHSSWRLTMMSQTFAGGAAMKRVTDSSRAHRSQFRHSVGRGDQFEEMAVRILEIDAAPAPWWLISPGVAACRFGPDRSARVAGSAQSRDRKSPRRRGRHSAAWRSGRPSRMKSIETPLSISTTMKCAERLGGWRSSIRAQECRRTLLIAAPDDGVVELDGHCRSPPQSRSGAPGGKLAR